MRLKDRARFPPGGFRFYVAETKWSISPWISFDAAVAQIIQHRMGNPYLTQKNGWSTDAFVVAEELDQFNAAVCQQMKWMDYITEGGAQAMPSPKAMNQLSPFSQSAANAVGRLSAGVQTIREWEIAGGNLVSNELAEQRAATCAKRVGGKCSKNVGGDLTSWFTKPAAELIRLQLESRNNMKIHTTLDPLLGVCEACACPLKLKVHCPIDIITSKMRPEDRAALDSGCWILSESK